MSLQGLDVFYTAAQQQTSTTDLLTVYRTPYEREQAFVQALIQGKEELDLASIIQAMNTPEDIFQREERWILAGGDCLFSEFEQKTEFPVHTHEDNTFAKLPLWMHIPLNYKVLTIGAVVYFVYHFFASFL